MKSSKKVLLCCGLVTCLFMNTSTAAINRIKKAEGFEPKAYADGMISGVQQHSIGYGHQIKPGETNLLTMKISVDTATVLLRSDIAPLEAQINQDLRIKPTQNQFDALVDFGFNCGAGALAKVISTWNANTISSTKAVTDEILMYNKTHNAAGQLVVSADLTARRKAEVALFNSGVSPAAKSGLLAAGGVIVGTTVLYSLLT